MSDRAYMAKIHIARKQLGLDEDTYRALIARVSGGRTRTAGELTATECERVLKEFQSKGWVPTRRRRAGRAPAAAVMGRRLMLTKVGALLADQRLPWSYAEAILCRQRGLAKGVACPVEAANDSELRGLIAALAVRARRAANR